MKDFVSKITFGFLMAQLFPGLVSVIALSCAFRAPLLARQSSFLLSLDETTRFWFAETPRGVAFFLLSVGAGLFIHGLNWAVLGWLENHKKIDGRGLNIPSRKSFWHQWPIFFQLFLMPIKMLIEIVWMLFAPDIMNLTMEENLPGCKPEDIPKFNILYDFYLHFSQFYAHTAYACLLALGCFARVFTVFGWTERRGWLIGAIYLMCSALFLMGRIQLTSLFLAERAVCKRA